MKICLVLCEVLNTAKGDCSEWRSDQPWDSLWDRAVTSKTTLRTRLFALTAYLELAGGLLVGILLDVTACLVLLSWRRTAWVKNRRKLSNATFLWESQRKVCGATVLRKRVNEKCAVRAARLNWGAGGGRLDQPQLSAFSRTWPLLAFVQTITITITIR